METISAFPLAQGWDFLYNAPEKNLKEEYL